MITQWRLGSFKSIGMHQSFDLRPLTVFAGANSSGKSSVLQSMLLIAQTLTSKVSQRHLVLNGDLLRLGTFEDVQSHGASPREFTIGFTLHIDSKTHRSAVSHRASPRRFVAYTTPIEQADVAVDLAYDGSTTSSLADAGLPPNQVRLLRGRYAAILEAENGSPSPDRNRQVSLEVNRRSQEEMEAIRAGVRNEERWRLEESATEYAATLSPEDIPGRSLYFRSRLGDASIKRRLAAANMDHFLPSWFIVEVPYALKRVYAALEQLTDIPNKHVADTISEWLKNSDDTYRTLVAHSIVAEAAAQKTTPEQLLRREGKARTRSYAGIDQAVLAQLVARAMQNVPVAEKQRRDLEPTELPPDLEAVLSGVERIFAGMRYLGPLRDDPKPIYSLASSADPSDIGVKGEYTAAVLDLFADKRVTFVHPESRNKLTSTLSYAVSAWLQYFDIATEYSTTEEGKLGHRLVVRPHSVQQFLDLTNVGVGVSQVLPIVVMSLIAEPGSVLIFEQPELHLHPRVQALLGDFFLAMISAGRQCIIETHSEYLVNRLRLRAAEAPRSKPIHDEIMLYFTERNGPFSKFTPVAMNEYGAIPEWPKGFFDQGPSESEQILFAAMQKRAEGSSRGGGW